MRLLALALCAGLATALPTAYDTTDNEVGTSKTFKSSRSESESSHVSEESSYFYSSGGDNIIEITVAEAAQYDLVCVPSKELVQSAHLIVSETVDEEEEAAAAAAASGGASSSSATGGSASSSAAAVGGAASSAAAGESAASSAAAGESAASSAAAGESAASSAAAKESAASSAAAVGGAASSAAAGESAASSAAAGESAASSAAAGESAASSAAAGESAASSAAAKESAASSAAAVGGAASSAAAGESAASSAATGESAASSAAAGESAASSAAAGESAASSAAAGESAASSAAAGESAASSAAAGESAASSAAAGGSAASSAAGGASSAAAGVDTAVVKPTTIYVESLTVVDDLDRCRCVPFFLCKEENIVSDGAGEIDIRFGAGGSSSVNSKCSRVSSVCCLHPETKPLPYIVDELLAEPYTPSCGHINPKGFGFEIGGFVDSESQFAEYPYMGIVAQEEYEDGELKQRYLCGGSLIAKGVILTAAHCIKDKDASTLVVRLGDWDTKSLTELLPHHEYRVARTVVHEKFNKLSLFNTVALIFLETEVELQPHIDTICLPDESQLDSAYYDASSCIATGFGRDQFEGGEYQNVMKEVALKEVDHDTCQAQLRKTRLGRWFRLHKSFTCAGGEPGVDTCRGDGGSPLVCPLLSDPHRYVQVGIVAWGIGCGQRGVPGVYASIRELLPWIREHMHDQTGHLVEPSVGTLEPVQVCITQNPFTELYEEEIQIQVPEPVPEQFNTGGY